MCPGSSMCFLRLYVRWLLASLLVGVCVASGWACQDPESHPENPYRQSDQYRRALEVRNREFEARYGGDQERRSGLANESADYVDLEACLTSPAAEVDVPARTSGPLLLLNVQEMEEVQPGQTLATIDPEIAEMQVQSAQTRLDTALAKAGDDIAIRYARAAHRVAEKEKEINFELARKRSLPQQEYERSALAAEQASLQIEKSEHDLEIAQQEARAEEYNLNAARAALERHQIVAPLQGNVAQIYKEAGEWVNEGETVFRVIRMDTMRVEGLWDIARSQHLPSALAGSRVTVTMDIGGQPAQFSGKIVMIDLETSGGNRVTIRAEIENQMNQQRWILPAGAEVHMRIHVNTADPPQTANADGFEPQP